MHSGSQGKKVISWSRVQSDEFTGLCLKVEDADELEAVFHSAICTALEKAAQVADDRRGRCRHAMGSDSCKPCMEDIAVAYEIRALMEKP